VAIVHPGEYLVQPDSVIPANCALYGYDLRVTKLILSNSAQTAPASGTARRNNMFLMRNGIKARGFTFTGLEHEPFTLDGGPPQKGYAFAFNPGEVITRSPYISDCSMLHDFSQDQMALPIDKINSRGEPKLSAQAIQWPTPAAQNWKGSSETSVIRADGKSRMDILHYRAEQGFTHPVPAIMPDGRQCSHHAPISRPLWASMIASHGCAACRRILKARARRRLNPLFVGWLMGWPIGHALCSCSATEFILWQQHMRGALSRLPMASGPWIWRPSEEPESPAQMNLFEGMLP